MYLKISKYRMITLLYRNKKNRKRVIRENSHICLVRDKCEKAQESMQTLQRRQACHFGMLSRNNCYETNHTTSENHATSENQVKIM